MASRVRVQFPKADTTAIKAIPPPTHATNAIQLHGARLKYKRKLLTA